MKPLEEMNWLDVCRLLHYGTITLANGWTMHEWPRSDTWPHTYILRTPDETKTFTSASDLVNYVAFHGAAFAPAVVDAEDAKRERIERHLEKSREREDGGK